MRNAHFLVAVLLASVLPAYFAHAQPQPRIKVLFLGDNGHHKPRDRAADIVAPLARAGIDMAYTDDLNDLNDKNLARHDCLIIYANHTAITPSQEAALLKFVEGGKGLVAVHCASYCFLNSPKYIALVGGQFKSHGTGMFTAKIGKGEHPALKNVKEFEAWDETYTHQRLSDDREVLMFRVEGGKREPWTWVRRQGEGRVFYTASGHDERVFRNPEFQHLITQGIRWAVHRPDFVYKTEPFKRVPAELPNYLSGKRGGGRLKDMQAPVSVQESMKHISVPGGFKVELFAAEPDVVRPIAIAWDQRGRAYVAESVDYPNNLQREGAGHDRINLCEDTDGDGKADKFTIFADKLSIPTSMVAVNGGLIVAQPPHMLFLKDTDGDGKADVRQVLFTGFNTGDTHATASNLRLGVDNWVYATVGYSGFNGTVGGKQHQFRQGLFRFKADGSQLEFLGSSSNNTWGLGIGETGEIFYSTANGEHSSYLAIPNRYFEQVRGWLGKGVTRMADHTRIHPLTTIRQVDFHGGFTAAAGHALYTARHFPRPFWNRIAFVTEPTGHLVHMCLLEQQGSSFVTHDRFNLFASTDEWTAPIAAEVGPDGAVWVLDWYNYVVQHNPTPLGFKTGKGNAYETPLRDKTHGRIYRVVDSQSTALKPLDIAGMASSDLVGVLKNDNMSWRLAAQWELVRRGKRDDILAQLSAVVVDPKVDETKENLAAVHALWTLKGLRELDEGSPEPAMLAKALAHPSAGVRRAAAEVLPRTADCLQAILQSRLLDDPEPLVRRATLLVLSEMPSQVEAGKAVLAMLQKPENLKDRWIPLAATCAAARHDVGFLLAVLNSKNAAAVHESVRVVSEHYARGAPAGTVAEILQHLGSARPEDASVVLEGLAAGWPAGKAPRLEAPAQSNLKTLMGKLDSAGQLRLATLAGKWGLGQEFREALAALQQRLLANVADDKATDLARIEAARRVAAMQPDKATLEKLLAALTVQASPLLAGGILDAVGQSTSPELGTVLTDRWRQLTPKLQQKALGILLQRPEWSRALLVALEKNVIPITDLGLDQSQSLAGHPDAQIAARAKKILARGGSLPSPDRQKVLDELLPLTEKTGDVAVGFEVFKKTCAKCHRHGTTGETIGPNLTGFAVHPKSKLLTEIIDPNRSVEGNYRQYTVVTSSGRVFNGLLSSETKTAIELVDNEAKKHTILREDIEQFLSSPKSIMPEGFEKQLTQADFVNLLEFLTAKGKYLPLPLDKVATIVSTRGMFYNEADTRERLAFTDWSPKTVDGVPFQLIDPKGQRINNVVLFYGPQGKFPPKMPRTVKLPCNTPARAIHLLSGVSGWGSPGGQPGSVSLIVRLHYQDGKTEDHPLKNGEHFADYIRRVDVPGSKLAFTFKGGQQVRYLAVHPQRPDLIREIEFVKGPDRTAPIIMAVTVETR